MTKSAYNNNATNRRLYNWLSSYISTFALVSHLTALLGSKQAALGVQQSQVEAVKRNVLK